MHTASAKQEAIHAIEHLPDNVPFDEIIYRLYVLNKIQQGLHDVETGKTLSTEELEGEIEAW
jgi:predicted transcriptional regulator